MQFASAGEEPKGNGASGADSSSTASSDTRFNEEPEASHSEKQTSKVAKRKTTDTESQQQAYRELLEDLVYRKKEAGLKGKALSVAFRNLKVRGVGGSDDIIYGETVNTAFNPLASIKSKQKLKKIQAAKAEIATTEEKDRSNNTTQGESLKKGERYLLHDFNGVVKAGEMLLVIGRPGSGCTTFLKTLAGQTHGFAGIDGEVFYADRTIGQLKPEAKQIIFSSKTMCTILI